MAYATFSTFALAMFADTLAWSAGFTWYVLAFNMALVSTLMYVPLDMSLDPASVST